MLIVARAPHFQSEVGRFAAGKVYVYLPSGQLVWTNEGNQTDGRYAISTSKVPDIDGDSVADFVVGGD